MKPIITVNNLSLHYKVAKKEPGLQGAVAALIRPQYQWVKAVDEISFSINPGELVGFIGPNGAGKTTTLKMLSGLLYPTSGVVRVAEHEPFTREHDFLRKISLVMGQKNQLIWDLPATDSFMLNKAIYDIPDHSYRNMLNDLVTLLDVEQQLRTPVRKLSLGQRMKMELIAALLHTPKVLYLDEPTIGLDIVVQRNLRDFIKQYNERHNATILLTSHYMGDVQELCSRIIMISHGQVLFDGKLETLIRKHSPNKIIRVVFDNPVTQREVSKIGKIHDWSLPNVAFSVPRETATKQAAALLEHFAISDIGIEETPIEDIIRDAYHTL